MPKHEELTEQEWSHFFDVSDIETDGTNITIEPSDEERDDMARRLDVISIKDVSADLKIQNESSVHVKGIFKATITQECSVTVEPFDTEISEEVEGWFADKNSTVSFAAAKREKEASIARGEIEMLEEHEDPEPIIEGVIDLGELVTQHISLSIPPYPRKEGASYEFGDDNAKLDEKSPLRKNPFEALKDWKENR